MRDFDIEINKLDLRVCRNNITIWSCIFIISLLAWVGIAITYPLIHRPLLAGYAIGVATFFIIYSLFVLKRLYIDYTAERHLGALLILNRLPDLRD
jgi:hypothetical protein